MHLPRCAGAQATARGASFRIRKLRQASLSRRPRAGQSAIMGATSAETGAEAATSIARRNVLVIVVFGPWPATQTCIRGCVSELAKQAVGLRRRMDELESQTVHSLRQSQRPAQLVATRKQNV